MGKATNPKPRMAYAIDSKNKSFLDEWAEMEGRSTANLVERLLLDAIARKKQDSTVRVVSNGRNMSVRKT